MGNICGGERDESQSSNMQTASDLEAYITKYFDSDCKEWNRFLTKVAELALSEADAKTLETLKAKEADALTDDEKKELERLDGIKGTAIDSLKGNKDKREQFKLNAWISKDALKELLQSITTERVESNKQCNKNKANAHDAVLAAATAYTEAKEASGKEEDADKKTALLKKEQELKVALEKAEKDEEAAMAAWEKEHAREISSNASYVDTLVDWLSSEDGKALRGSLGGKPIVVKDSLDYHHFILALAKDGNEYEAYKRMCNDGRKEFASKCVEVNKAFDSFADGDGQVSKDKMIDLFKKLQEDFKDDKSHRIHSITTENVTKCLEWIDTDGNGQLCKDEMYVLLSKAYHDASKGFMDFMPKIEMDLGAIGSGLGSGINALGSGLNAVGSGIGSGLGAVGSGLGAVGNAVNPANLIPKKADGKDAESKDAEASDSAAEQTENKDDAKEEAPAAAEEDKGEAPAAPEEDKGEAPAAAEETAPAEEKASEDAPAEE